jgi:hypothetical protein
VLRILAMIQRKLTTVQTVQIDEPYLKALRIMSFEKELDKTRFEPLERRARKGVLKDEVGWFINTKTKEVDRAYS